MLRSLCRSLFFLFVAVAFIWLVMAIYIKLKVVFLSLRSHCKSFAGSSRIRSDGRAESPIIL